MEAHRQEVRPETRTNQRNIRQCSKGGTPRNTDEAGRRPGKANDRTKFRVHKHMQKSWNEEALASKSGKRTMRKKCRITRNWTVSKPGRYHRKLSREDHPNAAKRIKAPYKQDLQGRNEE